MLEKFKHHPYFQFLKEIFPGTKMLLLRYAVVGIYLIAFTLYANQFEIVDLTYFNSVYILYFLGEMIGFAVSSGASVFINQNITNKAKVTNYIKLGTVFSLVIGIIFILGLFLLKDWIFLTIMNIKIPDNYSLLYFMIPVILINVLASFWMSIVKILQKFKLYLLLTSLQSVLTALLIGISLIFLGLNMYVIPIVFFIAAFSIVVIIYIKLQNGSLTGEKFISNKQTKFKLKDYKFELRKLTLFLGTEMMWSLSSTMVGIFLLSNNEILYNAYNYYENVYDVLNGLFFAFIMVVNISISISLGQGKFEEAYKKGKYAIITSILIWIIYASIAVVFSGLVTKGMNVEIIDVGKTILLVYLLIYLFRFLDWGMGTYIIVCGGNIRVTFFIELFSIIYFILLIVFSSYIPNNPYLLILLVGSDSIVKGSFYFWYFKSKKWIVKLS